MWFLSQLVCLKQDPKESDILCLAHMPLTVSLLLQEFLSSPSFLFPSNSFLEETRSGHWHSTSPWILIHLSLFSISYLLCFPYTRIWILSKSSFNSFGENTSRGQGRGVVLALHHIHAWVSFCVMLRLMSGFRCCLPNPCIIKTLIVLHAFCAHYLEPLFGAEK